MTEKKHGLIGNINAVKEKTASANLHIRMQPDDKAFYSALANEMGMPLSAWIIEAMKEKAEKQK